MPKISRGTSIIVIVVAIVAVAGAITLLNPAAKPVSTSSKDEIAMIETKFGKIIIEFLPDVAPNHVENFKKLTKSGFYDGTTFHRIIPGFVIQGGDPNSKDDDRSNDGFGGPGYSIPVEFSNMKHVKGIVSMARGRDPNSAGSQFFIVLENLPHLDGQYSVFGRVIEGIEVADRIASVPRDQNDNPLEKVVMTRVTVQSKS